MLRERAFKQDLVNCISFHEGGKAYLRVGNGLGKYFEPKVEFR